VGDFAYFRQPNGWITVSEVGKRRQMLHGYVEQGWTPLDREYGLFDFPKEYYVHHPFEVLFLRGGAREMPLAQVIALGYDRNPPVLPRCTLSLGVEHSQMTGRPLHFERCWQGAQKVTFPQLEGHVPETIPPCDFCDRDDFASKKARDQHQRVLHVEEIREIATAREMASGIQAAVAQGLGHQPPGKVAAGSGLPVAGMDARPYACALCGEMFTRLRGLDPDIALEAHVKLHEDVPTSE
jgi:hypothetical protein